MKAHSLSAQLSRLAKSWTHDPFHPSYQLQTFFTSLAKHPKLTSESVDAVQALKDNVVQKKVRQDANANASSFYFYFFGLYLVHFGFVVATIFFSYKTGVHASVL